MTGGSQLIHSAKTASPTAEWKEPRLRSITLSLFRSAGQTRTRTFDAFASRATRVEPKSNLLRELPVNNSSGNGSPTPWTWHPHLPGVTKAWLAQANGVCVKTISRWRERSSRAEVDLSSMTAQLGQTMAILRRPGSILPLWSRMAIAELAWEGASYAELAYKFRCGRSTVWRCVKYQSEAYHMLSGSRLLMKQQRARIMA